MPFNMKLVLPVALGLTLVSVTAYVAYYVFKKDDEEEIEGKRVKTSKVNIIEIKVPKSIVPALIGRNGSNIKEIEKNCGAVIHFKKFTDQDYDVCIIRGRNEATQLAETIIHDYISKQPHVIQEHIEVPGWAVGRIIGTGGMNINEISHRSGARVKVEGIPSNDHSSQRPITLRGTKEQIGVARKLIDHTIAEEKCRREVQQSARSPRHNQTPLSPISDYSDDLAESTGASIEVYVSAVSSPSRFWVQLVGPQVTQLDDLVTHMTEYYGHKENRDNHELKAVSVGQVVAAVFRHDGRWYRARIHDIRPNEFDPTQQVADVFYVDYGDSEYVSIQELCELRADLLRLRFQAMECFLAGVKPAGTEEETVAITSSGQRWHRWSSQAVERFEDLTHVARWKALVSRTCSYKKTATADGEKEKEIPGIRLFEVTEEGELDIGGVLVSEGWAAPASLASPRHSPSPRPPPFGALGSSRVLSLMMAAGRSSSVPKDLPNIEGRDTSWESNCTDKAPENDRLRTSMSVGSGLHDPNRSNTPPVSNFDTSNPEPTEVSSTHDQLNGSHEINEHDNVNGLHDHVSSDDFLHAERDYSDKQGSTDTLVPTTLQPLRDELKANMNRIDSHHSNLESLGRSQNELHMI